MTGVVSMAKKTAKGASKAVSKGKSKAMTYSDISDDEIDKCIENISCFNKLTLY